MLFVVQVMTSLPQDSCEDYCICYIIVVLGHQLSAIGQTFPSRLFIIMYPKSQLIFMSVAQGEISLVIKTAERVVYWTSSETVQ